jgi:hypothetical protein
MLFCRLDERVKIHLEGMARLGERVDGIDARTRTLETLGAAVTRRAEHMDTEMERLRATVDANRDTLASSRPVLEAGKLVAGWVVAALVALVFGVAQLGLFTVGKG